MKNYKVTSNRNVNKETNRQNKEKIYKVSKYIETCTKINKNMYIKICKYIEMYVEKKLCENIKNIQKVYKKYIQSV